jgi:hypothetical protein
MVLRCSFASGHFPTTTNKAEVTADAAAQLGFAADAALAFARPAQLKPDTLGGQRKGMPVSREQSHQRHAAVYIDRKGTKAIVVAQHYNGPGGVLVEDDGPTVVEDLTDTEKLTSVVVQALASSSVRDEVNLREPVAKDWPAFRVSGAKSKRAFEADFIVLSVHGATEANLTYLLEGFPEPNAELWVGAAVPASAPELGDRCLDVWRACRDRSL